MSLFHNVIYGGSTQSFICHKKKLMPLIKKYQEDGYVSEQKLSKQEKEDFNGEFYPWECISLMRRYSSLDFVIQDEDNLAAFFNYVWYTIYQQDDSKFMTVFRLLKFKMKIGYECWKRNCKLEELIKSAISKTIEESRILSLYNLQK